MPKKKAGRAKMPRAAATAARYRLPTARVAPAPSAVWQKAVSAQPSPAPARAWPSPRRESFLSAKRPPAQAPSARQASTTPMRLVQTTAEVPTCGASTRPPTISSTMTSAPLKKTVSSSMPSPFPGEGVQAGESAARRASETPSGEDFCSLARTVNSGREQKSSPLSVSFRKNRATGPRRPRPAPRPCARTR